MKALMAVPRRRLRDNNDGGGRGSGYGSGSNDDNHGERGGDDRSERGGSHDNRGEGGNYHDSWYGGVFPHVAMIVICHLLSYHADGTNRTCACISTISISSACIDKWRSCKPCHSHVEVASTACLHGPGACNVTLQ